MGLECIKRVVYLARKRRPRLRACTERCLVQSFECDNMLSTIGLVELAINALLYVNEVHPKEEFIRTNWRGLRCWILGLEEDQARIKTCLDTATELYERNDCSIQVKFVLKKYGKITEEYLFNIDNSVPEEEKQMKMFLIIWKILVTPPDEFECSENFGEFTIEYDLFIMLHSPVSFSALSSCNLSVSRPNRSPEEKIMDKKNVLYELNTYRSDNTVENEVDEVLLLKSPGDAKVTVFQKTRSRGISTEKIEELGKKSVVKLEHVPHITNMVLTMKNINPRENNSSDLNEVENTEEPSEVEESDTEPSEVEESEKEEPSEGEESENEETSEFDESEIEEPSEIKSEQEKPSEVESGVEEPSEVESEAEEPSEGEGSETEEPLEVEESETEGNMKKRKVEEFRTKRGKATEGEASGFETITVLRTWNEKQLLNIKKKMRRFWKLRYQKNFRKFIKKKAFKGAWELMTSKMVEEPLEVGESEMEEPSEVEESETEEPSEIKSEQEKPSEVESGVEEPSEVESEAEQTSEGEESETEEPSEVEESETEEPLEVEESETEENMKKRKVEEFRTKRGKATEVEASGFETITVLRTWNEKQLLNIKKKMRRFWKLRYQKNLRKFNKKRAFKGAWELMTSKMVEESMEVEGAGKTQKVDKVKIKQEPQEFVNGSPKYMKAVKNWPGIAGESEEEEPSEFEESEAEELSEVKREVDESSEIDQSESEEYCQNEIPTRIKGEVQESSEVDQSEMEEYSQNRIPTRIKREVEESSEVDQSETEEYSQNGIPTRIKREVEESSEVDQSETEEYSQNGIPTRIKREVEESPEVDQSETEEYSQNGIPTRIEHEIKVGESQIENSSDVDESDAEEPSDVESEIEEPENEASETEELLEEPQIRDNNTGFSKLEITSERIIPRYFLQV